MASNFWNGEFYFNGIHSSVYKVCMIDFNSREMVKLIGGSHSVLLDKETSYRGNILYKESEKTSENITLQLCRTDNKAWTATDLIYLNSWLFQKNFKKFQPIDFSNQGYNLIYYLKAIDMKKYLTPNMRGYIEVVFQPYDSYVYAIPTNSMELSSYETKTINSLSNISDPYYPKIKLINYGYKDNHITITNNTNGKKLEIEGVNNQEIIYIDCAIGSVVNSNNENRFDTLYNYDFISLENGNNDISLSGSCAIEFICEFPIIL